MKLKFFKYLPIVFMPIILIITSGLNGAKGSRVSGTSHVVFSAILYDSDAVYHADVDLGTGLTSYSIWV